MKSGPCGESQGLMLTSFDALYPGSVLRMNTESYDLQVAKVLSVFRSFRPTSTHLQHFSGSFHLGAERLGIQR